MDNKQLLCPWFSPTNGQFPLNNLFCLWLIPFASLTFFLLDWLRSDTPKFFQKKRMRVWFEVRFIPYARVNENNLYRSLRSLLFDSFNLEPKSSFKRSAHTCWFEVRLSYLIWFWSCLLTPTDLFKRSAHVREIKLFLFYARAWGRFQMVLYIKCFLPENEQIP